MMSVRDIFSQDNTQMAQEKGSLIKRVLIFFLSKCFSVTRHQVDQVAKLIYHKLSAIWGHFLIIIMTICMGSGWPLFSENTLMLYQQDLQLDPHFVKWELVTDRGWPRFPIRHFAK